MGWRGCTGTTAVPISIRSVSAPITAAAVDPQTIANGYVVDCETSAGVPFKLAGVPLQYDGVPPQARRAPEFNEHGDDILQEVGFDWDAIVDLKARGVVA